MTSATGCPPVVSRVCLSARAASLQVRSAVVPEVSHGEVYTALRRVGRAQRSIAVAHAAGGRTDPPVFVGEIGTRQADIDRLIRRLQGKAPALRFVYEAGPSGYGLYRYLTKQGWPCDVVAPR